MMRMCKGIGSARVDGYAPSHPEWCIRYGIQLCHSTYHSVRCVGNDDSVDAYYKCTACRSTYNNTNRKKRHPELFDSNSSTVPSTTPDDSCNSVIDHIFKLLTHRLTIIGGDDIITDRQLLDYAHTLRAQNMNIIRLANRQYFLVCSGCESHEVVQAQMKESMLCGQCRMETGQLGLRRASSKRARRANNTHKST